MLLFLMHGTVTSPCKKEGEEVSYGEHWLRVQYSIAQSRKPKLIVTKEEGKRIQKEIERLQQEREKLYLDDEMEDNELARRTMCISQQISDLIDQKYSKRKEE